MYRPTAFDVADVAELHELVRRRGVAHLVTRGTDGSLDATVLPVLLDTGPGDGPLGTLRGHVARPNPQWQSCDTGTEALAIVAGPDAYISPTWYASKREHAKVVPTWNYEVVHAHGPLAVVDDPAWLRDLVTRLTDRQESGRPEPWAVTDAPEGYFASMLRGIVGLELRITRLEGKAKLSQNRPPADVDGVIAGLEAGTPTDRAVAQAMRAARAGQGEPPVSG